MDPVFLTNRIHINPEMVLENCLLSFSFSIIKKAGINLKQEVLSNINLVSSEEVFLVVPNGETIVDIIIPCICSIYSLLVQNEAVSNPLGFSRNVPVHGIFNDSINTKIKSILGGKDFCFFWARYIPRSDSGATVGRTAFL